MARESTQKGARPGPRPRGPFEGKRSTLTTRITVGTRKKLEDSARDAGRSLSQEIELRLDRSYAQEDELFARFGGKGQYRWLLLLAATLQMVEEVTGAKWDKDHLTKLLQNVGFEVLGALRSALRIAGLALLEPGVLGRPPVSSFVIVSHFCNSWRGVVDGSMGRLDLLLDRDASIVANDAPDSA